MQNNQLVVDTRTTTGKGAARKLRRDGKIPAVIYGEGENISLTIDALDWSRRFKNVASNAIITLKHNDKDHSVLIKDVQSDLISGQVFHVDFYSISVDKKLHTMVPIHLEGTPVGVREGGILEHKIEKLEVICLPKDIPSYFAVDIVPLEIGDSLHVRDIDCPEGVEIKTEEHLTVVLVSHAKVEEEPVEADEIDVEEELEQEVDEEI